MPSSPILQACLEHGGAVQVGGMLVELDAGGSPGEHLLQTSPPLDSSVEMPFVGGLGAAALARSAASRLNWFLCRQSVSRCGGGRYGLAVNF